MPDLAPLRRLLDAGAIDADLAALVWMLLDARTPVLVVSRSETACAAILDALGPLLPAGTRMARAWPDDEFDWLPEAVELGWRRDRDALVRPAPARRLGPSDGVIVVHGLASPGGVEGERARIVVRALALGYGLLATMAGEGLDDALETLRLPPVGTDEDERSRLGVVLVVVDEGGMPRVTAAHYVRPVALDTHGHVQRQPPAVLATWNPGAACWDHFAWGVLPDLAGRLGTRPIDVEREQARRAAMLSSA